MENLLEFKERIYSFQKNKISEDEEFKVNKSLYKKVNKKGELKEFFGDTVVFDLDKSEKEILYKIQEILYKEGEISLAEKLSKESFHITLHDLSSGDKDYNIIEDMERNLRVIKELKKEVKTLDYSSIKVKSTYVFNMVNTSLVLGLEAIDEENHNKLFSLYELFDRVIKLGYPLTPHITLAYYKDKEISKEEIKNLNRAIEKVNKEEYYFNLNLYNLFYETFTNMNDYIKILNLK